MSINSLGANGSMLAQLQRMQQQMRTLTDVANGNHVNQAKVDNSPVYNPSAQAVQAEQAKEPDNVGAFANMLNQAFENVNFLQNDSSNKQTRFDLGDRSVTLSDVMLASQKSSISFEATIQIRNKMIEAYKTISQMQI
ncbi:MAG: flagellar hook-basal body complex protein FliE [Succinivibrio sp.]|jgi:flagellar hook-basal body complex protein FliE|nr:flagellar hook-basal body complex protein FliE [Succinivibrio sp.]MDD6068579.1 flagellar hook-basal body complex protein FliE [Succinivibrio sp.]MDY3107876.1 flagellar hook-basal body complex protein FliE [Succinivibrio sp.]MDY4992649.1 flagellar hook-basal body complex protein FliE [Succinivibrio sp.]MDY5189284.1 flagellar hook-basal body complex protein FliE [Succinivibrio sp.]